MRGLIKCGPYNNPILEDISKSGIDCLNSALPGVKGESVFLILSSYPMIFLPPITGTRMRAMPDASMPLRALRSWIAS